ncbi:MAG TPA: 2-oxoglutarate dehydrogenase E1 component, partial [Thiobacillaceae bacterium]|nr:2-oxoglutarate dehydrogenase E1 component [Thiobacillaceae bacterium]
LVIWEAQFGDFANGAQVVIDQFIASGETKWDRLNGLTLFLPHGYEGQGPEHSSGRIERFLQLTAHDNIQIVQPTTPAQIFHLLRRQVVRPYRKPLVVFTPKSLLRHPEAISQLQELSQDAFKPILDDSCLGTAVGDISRLVFCSGRIYYDLARIRKERNLQHIALIRIEQLYPVPDLELQAIMARYPNAKEIIWAQDEPRNQGPWRFMAHHLGQNTRHAPIYAGRPESSAPATGIASLHKNQLEEIIAIALA